MERSMRGFIGPRDIFRNPEAIFRFFEPTSEGKERWKEMAPSPFDLVLAHSGDDFAVMGMHFKLGLYEHQSAGAIQGLIDLIAKNPALLADAAGGKIRAITITAYEPAFGIIGNPAKKDPKTRQSADHSMAYIIATLLRKALEHRAKAGAVPAGGGAHDEAWKALMLAPADYSKDALFNPRTRELMGRIEFRHGGKEYDEKYPDGIPTSIQVTDSSGKAHDSGLVMYPAGHARNRTADLNAILSHKFRMLGALAVNDLDGALARLTGMGQKSAVDVAKLYADSFRIGGPGDARSRRCGGSPGMPQASDVVPTPRGYGTYPSESVFMKATSAASSSDDSPRSPSSSVLTFTGTSGGGQTPTSRVL
jgi:2-methylcitrate dehydratase